MADFELDMLRIDWVHPIVVITQGTTMGEITCRLWQDGEPYHIADGDRAVFRALGQDGQVLEIPATVSTDRTTVQIPLDAGFTDTFGNITADIALVKDEIDENGETRVCARMSSGWFGIRIQPDVLHTLQWITGREPTMDMPLYDEPGSESVL